MTEKKTLCLFVIPLLIATITMAGMPPVHAQIPVMSLKPLETTVPALLAKFTVDVNVTGVTNMKGFSFYLWYNTTILDATLISPTSISDDATDWVPVDENLTFHWDGPPTINDTMGRIWVGAWGFTTFTGGGSLLTINFTANALGTTTLHLNETELLDNMGDPIVHGVVDGEVTVVPEFPIFMIMPLLMVTSLAAALLGKMFWSRKRKRMPHCQVR